MTTKTINVKTKTISEPILNNNNNNISDNYLDYNFNSDFSYYENEKSEEETFDLYEYFQIYNEIFFENLLGCISLSWSSKMTSCAGVFSVYKGVPTIRLSESLLKFRTITEVKETLLHEMIHAYCFIKKYDMSDDLSGHGKYFKEKMNEINKETGFNVSVYHKFLDEVSYYAKYVWRCNGICRNKKPYYGYVRRQMNRPPQKADKWFMKHQKECGGTFIRISPTEEEEKKEKELKKKKLKKKRNEKKKSQSKSKNKSQNKNQNQNKTQNKKIKKKDFLEINSFGEQNEKNKKKRKESVNYNSFNNNIHTLNDYK